MAITEQYRMGLLADLPFCLLGAVLHEIRYVVLQVSRLARNSHTAIKKCYQIINFSLIEHQNTLCIQNLCQL